MNLVNETTLNFHFQEINVIGRWNIPDDVPFVLLANHTSRFDGLMVQHSLMRPANYMVSPNELKGLQGVVLPWVGAFPANPRLDLVGYSHSRFEKGEGLVIFPEGNIFYDGSTHPFKPGAARIILSSRQRGMPLKVIPSAIVYEESPLRRASMLIGESVNIDEFVRDYETDSAGAVKNLSISLHREICHLRSALGVTKDRDQVLTGRPVKNWAASAAMVAQESMPANPIKLSPCALTNAVARV